MAKELVCTLCGYAGEAKQKARGNGLVEFILWWFFIVPGLIYSIWSRGGSKKSVCPKCGSDKMIPQDTPLGQKLMSEHPKPTKEAIEQSKQEEANRAHNRKVLWIVLGCFFGFPIILGLIFGGSDKKDNNVEPTLHEETPAKADLPTDPQERIEAIVKSLGENYEITIFDENSNVGSKIKSPFQVVINTNAGSCALAKQMNFDIMKALFTDAVARRNIVKIRFNARTYISTSLGGADGREMPVTEWKESGPSNLFKVLSQMGSMDLSSRKMERQTWGKELEGCK